MATTHAQLAYQYLRDQLIAGMHAPGTRIRYGPVGKELGISATPVREAIGLLANEGFVELIPQRGAVVRSVGTDEIIQLYEVREAIEPYAAGKAASRSTKSQRLAINQTLKRMQGIAEKVCRRKDGIASATEAASFEKADLAFHMLVIASGANPMMVRLSENSNVLSRVFAVYRHGYDEQILRSTCADHASVLAAIVDGDADRAAGSMRDHIRRGLQVTMDVIKNQTTPRREPH